MIEFEIDYWLGKARTPDGTRFRRWSHTVISLRGVPGGAGAWSDLGLYVPTACVEVIGSDHPDRKTEIRLHGSFEAPGNLKDAVKRRAAKVRGGFSASAGRHWTLRSTSIDLAEARLRECTTDAGYVGQVLSVLRALMIEARSTTGPSAKARAEQVDRFLAALPVS